MISQVECRGFRALQDVNLPISPLTAIVGPNGSGKTSFLRAINLVLGTFWPSLRSIRVPEDFTDFDTSHDLSITVVFDGALRREDALGEHDDVGALRAKCTQYKRKAKRGDVGDLHFEFEPLKRDGQAMFHAVSRPTKGKAPEFRPLTYVSTGVRDQARILFIDHRRSLVQHLPSTRGSALRQLFQPALREFEKGGEGVGRDEFRERYMRAMDALKTPQIIEVESTIAETAKRMLGFLGARRLGGVDVRFGFADPANPFNSLRLVYTETDKEVPGEELGLGIQSAIVVGIFDALRRIGGSIGTLVIEEPEMYLHPQAQRYFYGLLRDMVDRGECQVIYSTHSSIFADATNFEAIRLFRREPGKSTSVSYVQRTEDRAFLEERRAAQKLIAFDSSRNELLFSRCTLFVEGPGDRLAVRLAAQKMDIDLDAEDLAIVDCGSKSAVPFFVRVAAALGVPYVVLHDEDIYPEAGDDELRTRIKQENRRAMKLNEEIRQAAGDDSRLFVAKPSLEGLLNIGRRTRDKPKRVIDALEGLTKDSLPEVLREALATLVN